MPNPACELPVIEDSPINCPPTCPVNPERNLLAAMLARAICDGYGPAQLEPQVKREARYWLFCALQPLKPFTFAWTAAQLDLDPAELQKALWEQVADPVGFAERLMVLRS